jgi:hypothetical protein
MTHRTDAWLASVAVALVACGAADNGGVEVSFGPSSVSSTTIGGDESSSEGGESSGAVDEPDPTTDPLPPPDATDWGEASESSGGLDDESSSDGGDPPALDCEGLDEATCGVTFGCGWPLGIEIFGVPGGPCVWDPLACAAFDQLTCTTSPACTTAFGEQNQVTCTGVSCELLDELTCPTVFGCQWIGSGGCLG